MAEANGVKCVMTDGSGSEVKPVSDKAEIEEVRGIVTQWADNLAAGLDPTIETPLWVDDCECDYYTDKPDWLAFGALVMLQACRLLNKPLPEYVNDDWDAFKEPAVKEVMSRSDVNSLLAGASVWLPLPATAIFVAQLPTGAETTFSTVESLRNELEELNRQMWQADEATIISWRNDKYYIPVKQDKEKTFFGFISRSSKKQKYRTEDLAQCGYSILYQAMCFAREHNVPIIADY